MALKQADYSLIEKKIPFLFYTFIRKTVSWVYFESALIKELQAVFGFEEDNAKSIVQLAKETGEYQDLCACVQLRKDTQEVMQDV